MQDYQSIRRLIDAVRRRWLRVRAFRATIQAALVVAFVIGATLIAVRWMTGHPGVLAASAVTAVAAVLAAAVWSLAPLRRRPSDAQVARFIEERSPTLEDRLASAVDVAAKRDGQTSAISAFDDLAVSDAARRADVVDIDSVVPADRMRRSGFQAAGALALVAIILFAGREPAREALDAASLTFFPARTSLAVTPGDARIKAGTALNVQARLVGNRAPVIAQLQIADGETWRTADMSPDGRGQFYLSMNAVTAPFTYRVVAGTITSPAYKVTVAHAPRV
ncbi:MAG TPA: hypothetical protein VGY57_10540, partial [Vicinamibacterales bacterium]|nr:hypothetical protein [Vicinamibacterales bacterium]